MNQPVSVFIVQHLHVHDDGSECVKMIGVYESQESAERAVQRLKDQLGFRDWPTIIDPNKLEDGDNESGFYIGSYTLGQDHWTEGYVTM